MRKVYSAHNMTRWTLLITHTFRSNVVIKMKFFAILPFLRLVYGCRYVGVSPVYLSLHSNTFGANYQDPITGIATPTPLTYTHSVFVSDCETNPTSFLDYLTAIVDGTRYPAINPVLVVFSNLGYTYPAFTFPGLIVTILTPAQRFTMVSNT